MALLIPVVLSGGAGTRLWPVSRDGHPKPFMKMADGESLLEKTYRRASSLIGHQENNARASILTVTNTDYYFISRDELAKVGVSGAFLLEPSGKNTGPAIALATLWVQEKFGPDTILLVLAADHLIEDDAKFIESVNHAVELAKRDFLVTFGITPFAPETGFGYIEVAEKVGEGFKVKSFKEKPSSSLASEFLDKGNFLWNSGIFCFKCENFLNEISLHSPNLSQAAKLCWDSSSKDFEGDYPIMELLAKDFEVLPSVSIDHALIEKSKNVAVVKALFDWSDVGSWSAIRDLAIPDENNNRLIGNAIFYDTANTFIQSEDRLVAAVGLDNLMIIDTADALLVANPENSQDVKSVVALLKKSGHQTTSHHKTIVRPWGSYTVLEEGPGFKIKRLMVKPGGSLSLQMHQHRSEHWVVVSGDAVVINGDIEIIVRQNQSTFIPALNKHRLENRTDKELILIEVQCGDYLGEDDIVRFHDHYGRT